MSDLARLGSEGDLNVSPRRARWQTENIGADTQDLLDEDARYFLHQSLSTPCLNALRGCGGASIEDLQGRRYLDFHGNYVHQVGFGNPAVVAAIKAQLDQLPFCTRRYTNRTAVALARRLAALAPGDLNKVLFCPGGTSAIGMALKLARAATGRHKTISMWDSFHGASLDAISIGGERIFREGAGPLLPGAEHVPPPDSYRCVWDCRTRGGCDLKCADYIDYVLEREGDVAAVIAETVRATPVIPHRDFWRTVRRACDRHGAVPDMLVIGKGLGGGILPLAALLAREPLDVAADRALGHYTHEKNPVLCAAGLATLDYIEEQGLLARSRELGEYLLRRLEAMKARHPVIGDVRALGLLAGIELVADHTSRAAASDTADAVMYAALSRGLSFKLTMGSIITLAPPLTVATDELDRALAILDECLSDVERQRR
jgi:4-aminobutyrate aminotransferase